MFDLSHWFWMTTGALMGVITAFCKYYTYKIIDGALDVIARIRTHGGRCEVEKPVLYYLRYDGLLGDSSSTYASTLPTALKSSDHPQSLPNWLIESEEVDQLNDCGVSDVIYQYNDNVHHYAIDQKTTFPIYKPDDLDSAPDFYIDDIYLLNDKDGVLVPTSITKNYLERLVVDCAGPKNNFYTDIRSLSKLSIYAHYQTLINKFPDSTLVIISIYGDEHRLRLNI